jgi:transcriptional regulator with AbiEi antitoxin domain of type IV toxin-antitoxin system
MTVTTTNPRPRSAPTAANLQAGVPLPGSDEVLPFRTIDCPDEAEQLLRQGLVRYVIADVMVALDAPDSRELRTAAAGLLIPHPARVGPDWVIGFASAAWLHTGLGPAGRSSPTESPPTEMHVIIPPGRRRPKVTGVRGRQVALAPDDIMFVDSLAVTGPVRTAADVARDLPAAQALSTLRRLGELCDVRPEQVLQCLRTMRYARGVALARQVIRDWTEQP